MFDERPTGISRRFEPGIRLARGPPGLVRAFSDTESLGLRPSRPTGSTDSSVSPLETEYARTPRAVADGSLSLAQADAELKGCNR